MRHSLAVSLLLTGFVGGACAAQKQYNPPAQQMVPFETHVNMGPTSSGSSSFRSSAGAGAGDDDYSEEFSGGGKGLSVPRRGRNVDSIEFVARPDVLTAEFAVREVRPTSEAALDAAKASSAAVLAQLAQATGGAASTKLRGMTIAKVVRKKQFVGVSVTVDGLLEVRLPTELDFWGRTRLLTTLLEAMNRLSAIARSADEPLRAVKFEDVQPTVQNPEIYRPQLMERWITRARAFAALAQSKETPLWLVDCAPPQTITTSRASLEEVTLQLTMNCRLDGGNLTRSTRVEP